MTYSGPARTAARSLESSFSSAPGVPAARRTAPPGRLLAAVALVALIGAGCATAPAETGSGGGENPATTGSPSTEPDPNAAGGTGDGGSGDQNAATEGGSIPRENSLKFAECVRENGVEDFPDPDADGIIVYYGEDPEFTSAQQNCRHLRPGPEGPNQGNGG
jgi:hypothetical protein